MKNETTFLEKLLGMTLIAMVFVAMAFIVMSIPQCSAKSFGGSITVDLPTGKKLVNVTWKETNLWCLVKDASATDKAEKYLFMEKSTFGILQGQITIVEHIGLEK